MDREGATCCVGYKAWSPPAQYIISIILLSACFTIPFQRISTVFPRLFQCPFNVIPTTFWASVRSPTAHFKEEPSRGFPILERLEALSAF